MGTNTDPYQPIEREWRVTRSILQVLAEFKNPVAIVTKSALITRDIDIFGADGRRRPGQGCAFRHHARPQARAYHGAACRHAVERRLDTLRALAAAGIPTGVMTAPIIPALNDEEMESILAAAAEAGAIQAGYTLLRLPLEIKDLFREWLEAQVPDRAKHVMSLVRSMRGGKDYDSHWNTRMTGTGPYANLISQRFAIATAASASTRGPLDASKFRRPQQSGDQLALSAIG
jgi:DNA repair photolyase